MDPSPHSMDSKPFESDVETPTNIITSSFFPALADIWATTRTPLDLRVDEPFTPPAIPRPPVPSRIVALDLAEPQHDQDDDDDAHVAGPEVTGFSAEEAIAAAQEGIHYATEKYPSENSSVSPTFQKEPVALEKGDKVFVVDEVQLSPYLSGMRVRVERTGQVGLVPVWVVEGALERLARENMAFNEAVTCPVEMTADNKSQENKGCTINHRHSRCITTTRTKITRGPPLPEQEEEPSEDELPLTPRPVEKVLYTEVRRTKSVMFEAVQQRKIFRYPPPPELFVPVKRLAWEDSDSDDSDSDDVGGGQMKQDKKQKIGSEETPENNNEDEENEHWWWNGWEEVPEKPFAEPEARGGRPQVRRRSRWFSTSGDSSDED